MLIVVSGAPATGKSTLATRLARELMVPALLKDDAKEALFDALGTPEDRRASSRLGRGVIAALIAVSRRSLEAGADLILEVNFRRGAGEADLEPLVRAGDVRLVHCEAPPEVIVDRYRTRTGRHPGHHDAQALPDLVAGLERGEFDPLDLDVPLLRVEVGDGYRPGWEAIVAFCRRSRPMLDRLARAGVPHDADPVAAWLKLRAAEGARVTVLDLYRLVAEPRGIDSHALPAGERGALARAVMSSVWPGFETTAGTERQDPVEVVEHDPSWPAVFESWRARIAEALGPAALRIEHVGSTAVPGLPAKPTVDIQVSVPDVEDEPAFVPRLESLGLRLRSRDRLHRYFRPAAGLARSVHVHVCGAGSDWERDHLRFRDRLRADPEACSRYAEVKREAARVWADDRWAYTDAKTEVILDILGDPAPPVPADQPPSSSRRAAHR